jgi:TolB-like protein
MSEPMKAVFLSYASQDAEAAQRICECLRATGVEVWFDQSELRGGDVWDHKIRQQIHDCSLFMPVISAHSDERSEGYFRLEWKLAVDRSYLMADDAAFLFPVVIDGTSDANARVPERFRSVQWTRVLAGEVSPAFCQRVSALLAGTAKPSQGSGGVAPSRAAVPAPRSKVRRALAAAAVLAVVGVIGVLSWRVVTQMPRAGAERATAPVANKIPEHSIAVLPFANLSAGKDQEYFSDGLAEELLNLLSKVPGLQVAARTSAFSFKGHAVDVPTIGRQLLVAHVLEGSVRKVGNRLRVTVQLERADNGYQIWSETYDRELGDVFHMQDEIAAAVVKALRVSLLGTAPPSTTATQSSDAYLVFLQARAKMATQRTADVQSAADDFARVIKLDPKYAPAYVELVNAKMQLADFVVTDQRRAVLYAAIEQCKVLIEQALVLDPANAQAYLARGYIRVFTDLAGAEEDYRRAIKLNPNLARAYADLASILFEDPRRRDEALAMITRAHQLDPLDEEYDVLRARDLFLGRSDTRGADALMTDEVARHPLYFPGLGLLGDIQRQEGHFASAAMYNEQALKLDPLQDWARRSLVMIYVDAHDVVAARHVADEAPRPLPIQRLMIYIHDADWQKAAQVSYAALANGTDLPINEAWITYALRMDAHRRGDYRQARGTLERMCKVTWSANGIPALPTQIGLAAASVALGDLLIASGDRDRGERLLRASLADMNYIEHDLKRGDLWYLGDQAIALALLDDRKASLAALHRASDEGFTAGMWTVENDPAFNAMRTDPEFQGIVRAIEQRRTSERQAMDRLRAEGKLPYRGQSAPSAAAAPK